MAAEWYVKLVGKQLGPLTPTQLKAMAKEGKISAGDPVRRGEEGGWVQAARVRGLFPPAEPAAGGPPEPKQSAPNPTEAPPVSHASVPPASVPPVEPPARPVAASVPTAVPVAEPAEGQAGEIPLARPATQVSSPPVSAPPPNAGFHIETDAHTPTARFAGQRPAGPGGRSRRRKNEAILVVVLAVLLVGLMGVWLGMIVPAKSGRTASDSREGANAAAESQGPKEPSEVVIPGLDEYLGQAGSPRADRTAAQSETSAASAASEWIDASESPVRHGDVRVRITSAEVGPPRLIHRSSGQVARPEGECLTLRLELYNENKTRMLPYTSWKVRRSGVSLVDDHDNAYALKSYLDRGLEIDGQVEGGKGSLYPEEATEDVLAFEKPARSATRLRLELPASAFGQRGTLRFEIPISMVATSAEAVVEQRDDPQDTWRRPEVEEDDRGPIPIPGVTGEGSRTDRVAPGFADAPSFREAEEGLREQEPSEDRNRRARDRRER